MSCMWCFNPRTHTGCDSRNWAVWLNEYLVVSIHAPTRGATIDKAREEIKSGFNPRTHTGCDSVQSYIL